MLRLKLWPYLQKYSKHRIVFRVLIFPRQKIVLTCAIGGKMKKKIFWKINFLKMGYKFWFLVEIDLHPPPGPMVSKKVFWAAQLFCSEHFFHFCPRIPPKIGDEVWLQTLTASLCVLWRKSPILPKTGGRCFYGKVKI